MALDAHHLACCEVGNEEDALTYEFLRILIVCSDARADSAVGTSTVVDSKLQEFLRLLNLLTCLDKTDTDIEFLKVFEAYNVLYRLSLEVGSLIGFLRCLQFVELLLDDIILDLLKQKRRLTQLVSSLEEIGRSQLLPLEGIEFEHLTQLLA